MPKCDTCGMEMQFTGIGDAEADRLYAMNGPLWVCFNPDCSDEYREVRP